MTSGRLVKLAVFTVIGLFLLAIAGCVGGRAPLLTRSRPVGGTALVLAPELRLGGAATVREQEQLLGLAEDELHQALARTGIAISPAEPAESFSELRRAMVAGILRGRAKGFGRLKPGTILELGSGAGKAGSASSVAMALFTFSGAATGAVPLDPSEIIPRPQDRPEVQIPKAGRQALPSSLSLDFLVVDLATGQVITHRQVVYPAANAAEFGEAVPKLVREATRGLTP